MSGPSSSSSSSVYIPPLTVDPSTVSYLNQNYSKTFATDKSVAMTTATAVGALKADLAAKMLIIAAQDSLQSSQIASLQASDVIQTASILANSQQLVAQASSISVTGARLDTNASKETLRSLAAESLISSRLSASVASNDTQFSQIATAMTSSHVAIGSSLSSLAQSIVDCQVSITTSECIANTEALTRSTADIALQTGIDANKAAIALESARASATEQAISTAVATILQKQSKDEGTYDSALATMNLARTQDEMNIVNIQGTVAALSTAVTTGTLTAGSVFTGLIQDDSGRGIVLASNHSQWGSSVVTVANRQDSNGVFFDTSNSQLDLFEQHFHTKTGDLKLSYDKRSPSDLLCPDNIASGELRVNTSMGSTFYTGGKQSGIAVGDFVVRQGTLKDCNDHDVTVAGSWTDAFNNLSAVVRLVRKGSMVTATLFPFFGVPVADGDLATFDQALPSWAVPSSQFCSAVCVATNGSVAIGYVTLANNKLSISPTSCSWSTVVGGSGGILLPTTFSYTL